MADSIEDPIWSARAHVRSRVKLTETIECFDISPALEAMTALKPLAVAKDAAIENWYFDACRAEANAVFASLVGDLLYELEAVEARP